MNAATLHLTRPPDWHLNAARLSPLKKRLARGEAAHIVGLGDSLTYGWMVSIGFYDRFIASLKERFGDTAIRSVNAGIPGDTAAGGKSRVARLVENISDVVIVQFGLNDMYQGVRIPVFEESLSDIIADVEKVKALPLLVTSSPLSWPEGEALSDAFYGAMAKLAAERNVPCVRLDRYWRACAGPSDGWRDLLQADQVHPTDHGHALMAEGLLSFFEDIPPCI